jgi:hypothetical protein
MAYTKHVWKDLIAEVGNRFTKSNETATSVDLIQNYVGLTQLGTPYNAEIMNEIEKGIEDAHLIAAENFKILNGYADCDESNSRDLGLILGVTTPSDFAGEISERLKSTSKYSFSDIMIGDVFNGLNLSAIPAENGGTAGEPWNNTYKNNQIIFAGLNPFLYSGDTQVSRKHALFHTRNIPFRKRMNSTDANAGGWPASELRAFFDGTNGDGTGDRAGVTTAAVLKALNGQFGAGHILPIRKLLSTKGSWAWTTCSVWLPTENEILGQSAWGEPNSGDGIKVQFPLYQKSTAYRVKLYHGGRDWWFTGTPAASSSARFALISLYGGANSNYASSVGGCAFAFCIF